LVTVIIRKLLVFFVPATTLLLTYLLIPRISSLQPAHHDIISILPYVIAVMGMLMSVHFHRVRPFLALLLLVFFYWCSQKYLGTNPAGSGYFCVYQTFIHLMPFNFMLFSLMRERGVFSVAGRMRIAFLLLQSVLGYWYCAAHKMQITVPLAGKYSFLPFMDATLVPQSALVIGALSIAVIGLSALRRQAPTEGGLLGAIVAFYAACNGIGHGPTHTLFMAAGAFIVLQAVILDSYNMAYRDDLTGVPSRRALNEQLSSLGRQYTIAMLDVDHFKKFNDTYGHDVGDQVLKLVGRKVLGVGGGGKAYRFGGEEFAIVFPGRKADDVIKHLEELRQNIADYSLALRSSERPKEQKQGQGLRGSKFNVEHVSVTVSIGVAESGDEFSTKEQVLRGADQALYKAKSWGRNMVCR